ncbi:Zinc finger, TFIIB-type [Phaffia rhodozyma]|uniref:Zinc finger, TFIIB-type n=1 Tax=Phaffia rhodozyma TaxID=264483 RepID=A0A0F7STP7_PHARH|nr:Zinc finger, TFIIB-type [Phaffia rhodozyma]
MQSRIKDKKCPNCSGSSFTLSDTYGETVCESCGTIVGSSAGTLVHRELGEGEGTYFEGTSRVQLGSVSSVSRFTAQGETAKQNRLERNTASKHLIESLGRQFRANNVVERAQFIYLASDAIKPVYRIKNLTTYVACAAFAMALRERKRTETLKDIAYAADLKLLKLNRVFMKLQREQAVNLLEITPASFLPRLVAHLSLISSDPSKALTHSTWLSRVNKNEVDRTTVGYLKKVDWSLVFELARALFHWFDRIHLYAGRAAMAVSIAVIMVAIEGTCEAPMPKATDVANELGKLEAVATFTIMERYREAGKAFLDWAEYIPGYDLSSRQVVVKSTVARRVVSKRKEIASLVKLVLENKELVWARRLELGVEQASPSQMTDEVLNKTNHDQSISNQDLERWKKEAAIGSEVEEISTWDDLSDSDSSSDSSDGEQEKKDNAYESVEKEDPMKDGLKPNPRSDVGQGVIIKPTEARGIPNNPVQSIDLYIQKTSEFGRTGPLRCLRTTSVPSASENELDLVDSQLVDNLADKIFSPPPLVSPSEAPSIGSTCLASLDERTSPPMLTTTTASPDNCSTHATILTPAPTIISTEQSAREDTPIAFPPIWPQSSENEHPVSSRPESISEYSCSDHQSGEHEGTEIYVDMFSLLPSVQASSTSRSSSAFRPSPPQDCTPNIRLSPCSSTKLPSLIDIASPFSSKLKTSPAATPSLGSSNTELVRSKRNSYLSSCSSSRMSRALAPASINSLTSPIPSVVGTNSVRVAESSSTYATRKASTGMRPKAYMRYRPSDYRRKNPYSHLNPDIIRSVLDAQDDSTELGRYILNGYGQNGRPLPAHVAPKSTIGVLAALRPGGVEDIVDDELFLDGELEGYVRDEEEVEFIKRLWDEEGKFDGVDELEVKRASRRRTDQEREARKLAAGVESVLGKRKLRAGVISRKARATKASAKLVAFVESLQNEEKEDVYDLKDEEMEIDELALDFGYGPEAAQLGRLIMGDGGPDEEEEEDEDEGDRIEYGEKEKEEEEGERDHVMFKKLRGEVTLGSDDV